MALDYEFECMQSKSDMFYHELPFCTCERQFVDKMPYLIITSWESPLTLFS